MTENGGNYNQEQEVENYGNGNMEKVAADLKILKQSMVNEPLKADFMEIQLTCRYSLDSKRNLVNGDSPIIKNTSFKKNSNSQKSKSKDQEDHEIDISPSINEEDGSSEKENGKKSSYRKSKKEIENDENGTYCTLPENEKMQERVNTSDKVLCRLYIITCISFSFMICEFIGGWISNSIAIQTDAAHVFSDVIGFIINILAINQGKKKATKKHSFGFHRSEVLGALLCVLIIWALIVVFIMESTERLIAIINKTSKFELNANIMIITSCIGLICQFSNLIALTQCDADGKGEFQKEDNDDQDQQQIKQSEKKDTLTLTNRMQQKKNLSRSMSNQSIQISQAGSDDENETSRPKGSVKKDEQEKEEKHKIENISQRAAILNMMGDVVQSCGVIIASIILKFKPEWKALDPIIAYLFSTIVILATLGLFKECINIIMETTPEDVEIEEMISELKGIDGVRSINDFHCWSLADSKNMVVVQLKIDDYSGQDYQSNVKRIYKMAKAAIEDEHEIIHSTVELVLCDDQKVCMEH